MLTDENSARRMQIMTLTDVNAALVKQRDDALLQLGQAKLALEIALPKMVHTFSGHVYADGKPVEFVDGCGKCRAMKVLAPTEKRNDVGTTICPWCGALFGCDGKTCVRNLS